MKQPYTLKTYLTNIKSQGFVQASKKDITRTLENIKDTWNETGNFNKTGLKGTLILFTLPMGIPIILYKTCEKYFKK